MSGSNMRLGQGEMAARRLVTIEGADDFVALCEVDENLAEADRWLRERRDHPTNSERVEDELADEGEWFGWS